VPDGVDFFVSYTSADRPWAEWIAWELEHAGYSVIVQAWDILPGANFPLAMHDAARTAGRTIAVLSPAFLESRYCAPEWAAAFREDPTGARRKLVPVRVRECQPDGTLGSVVYVDIVGLSEVASRAALLAGVTSRAKPADAPSFPGVAGEREGERMSRPSAGAAVFNVPVTTRTFVGREAQLERLAATLAGGGAVAITQVQAIHGMGGVGKTQLAAQFARAHRGDYDVVWWLRAEQEVTLRHDVAGLAVALGLVDGDVEEQDAVDAAQGWLGLNGRWLLLFDNAPSPEAIAGLVAQGMGGSVLITSRVHADWHALGAIALALDVWQREESVGFVRDRTGEQDRDVLDAVAAVLGDLPLALEQAVAYTNAKAITLSGYVDRLRTRSPELFAAGRPPGYEHTVASALLGACAHMAPERIPRELLEAVGDPDVDDDGGRGVDDAIELLLRYALLTATAEQTFAMHRLIGQLARAASAQTGAATAVRATDAVWPERPWEHETWPACQRLLAHALVATGHADTHATAPGQTATVLARVGQYLRQRAEYESAREVTERALGVFEAIYGPEHWLVATTLGNLGLVQQELGEFAAARASQQRALATKEALSGPEDPDIARTLENLGIVQAQLGEFEAARTTLQRALAIFEAVYGPEHTQVASALRNLGNVQLTLGEFAAARTTLQRVLAMLEAVYGPDQPDVAITLGSLGLVQERLGEYEAAQGTHQRALAIEEAVYGREHPTVARTLTNLGTVQLQLGQLEAAHSTQRRALAIMEAVHGPEHSAVASTLVNLGLVQEALGDYAAAGASQQRALAIEEASYGPEHPAVAITLRNLGNLQLRLGELEAARASLRRALAIFERFLGREHPDTRRARQHLAMIADTEQYVEDLQRWEQLPRLTRMRTARPERPTGI